MALDFTPTTVDELDPDRRPSARFALLPVLAVVVFLGVGSALLGLDPHVPLLWSIVFVGAFGQYLGYSWSDLYDGISNGLLMGLQALLIIFTIYALIATWVDAGTIPTMMYYGLELLSPAVFLPVATILAAVVAFAIGSSWTTVGTLGVAFVGIGAGLGVPSAMTVGAVISGAYAGDKQSPLSDTTNLAAGVTNTPLYDHIHRMRTGTLIAFGIAACSEPTRRFQAEGIVRGVDRQAGQVLIDHEEIEGLMDAMVMNFDVTDPALLDSLAEGQIVDFVVLFDGRSYRVDDVVVTGYVLGGSRSGFEDLVAVGDPAPAFDLIDQDGRTVSLASLRGSPVVLDFIYTSCPGPCPILTARQVRVQRRLTSRQRARVRFVSISLDPDRDTPEALRAYAEAHGADLESWSFLTGAPEKVGVVRDRYGIGSFRGEDGEIEHIVVTFIIDSDGRIAHRFMGLEHSSDEIMGALEQLGSG